MELRRFDDLDGFSARLVTSSHLKVHLRHSASKTRVSVLLVHVDCIGARVVSQDDAEVPDVTGFFLENLRKL